MLAWIAYTIAVTLLLGAAALAAERAARLRRASTRWIWGSAIVASLLLPTVISTVSIELPNISTPAAATRPIVLRNATAVSLSPSWLADKVAPVQAIAAARPDLDPLLQRAWMLVSAATLIALAASALLLHMRKRRWSTRAIAGVEVYVAPDAGPAVVGLLRPRIVVPDWLERSPQPTQALVIAHEKAHLDAGDPQLLTLALALLVLMPWNLPLWWQLHRLRHAIEIDCDARVLRAGHNLRQYGEALVDVGQHHSGFVGAAAAMAASRSLLEQRLRIMLDVPGRWRRARAALLAALALCMMTAAAQVVPPNAGPLGTQAALASYDPTDRHQINLSASRLVDYEGVYQLNEFQTMTVTRVGRRLWSQVNGRERIEQYPERADAFFSRDIDAQLTFGRDERGRVTGLVLHGRGVTRPAPQLDQASADALAEKIARFSARSTPMPGGEAALRRNADGLGTGKVAYEDLSPQFASEVRLRMPELIVFFKDKPLGRFQSIRFVKVIEGGWDHYRVEYERRNVDWFLLVGSDEKIIDAMFIQETRW